MQAAGFFAYILAVALLSLPLTRHVLYWLRRKAILDRPNDRSSHTVPTPRGGGIAILALVLPLWFVIAALYPDMAPTLFAVGTGAAVLAYISWLDDRRDLTPLMRLAVQMGVVAAALTFCFPGERSITQGLVPLVLERVVLFFAWVWFMNLYNFMDGIDGLSGVQTCALALGCGAVAMLQLFEIDQWMPWVSVTVMAACIGFLRYNWAPAKLFMGDVGSVPLGFLMGYLLIELALQGCWPAAVILPLYYLVDATWTLLRRLARRQKIWQPHREHFYQRAVQRGWSHGAVTAAIGITDLTLVVLAVVSVNAVYFLQQIAVVAAAGVAVGVLLFWLSNAQPRRLPADRPMR